MSNQNNPTPPPDEEEPPSEEESTNHHGGGRGGDSRGIIGANRSIRHRLSVRRVSAGGARDATGEEGAARAASGEIAGGGAFLSAESQLAKQEVLQEKELQELQAAK